MELRQGEEFGAETHWALRSSRPLGVRVLPPGVRWRGTTTLTATLAGAPSGSSGSLISLRRQTPGLRNGYYFPEHHWGRVQSRGVLLLSSRSRVNESTPRVLNFSEADRRVCVRFPTTRHHGELDSMGVANHQLTKRGRETLRFLS